MKIKYALLDRFQNLTSCEINMVIYIARRQDNTGMAYGLYYRDACDALGMCKQSFYNALYALAGKGIINIQDHSQSDYDVRLIGNDFSYKGAYQEGYIKLNRKVFHSSRFWELKAREKWLFMECMKLTHSSPHGCFRIYVKNLYKKYSGIFRVGKKVITSYLHTLKQFFSIGIKNGMYYITYKKSVFGEDYEESESSQYLKERIRVIFRRSRIRGYTEGDIAEGAALIKQYPAYADEAGRLRQFARAVRSCGKSLSMAYVHKTYRVYLGLDAPY